MFFNSNIKVLRKRKGFTQDVASGAMGFSRSTLNSYENGVVVNPTIDALLQFSNYYKVSIDTLIRVDLEKLSESQLRELEHGHDAFVKGTKLRVLATTVDKNNKDNIELVPVKASAGYTAGYNDPEFIRSLPSFQLPFLSSERKYRTFQISGDSMLPIPDKSYVTAEYVDNWFDIKDGAAYIIITQDEGIVFKMVYTSNLKNEKKLLLRSLNTLYQPYEVNVSDVKEVWKFINYISPEIPKSEPAKEELVHSVNNVQKELDKINAALRNIFSKELKPI